MATMDLCTEAVADATPPRKRSNSDSECGESGAADRKTKTPRTEPVPLKVGASPKPRRRGGVDPIDPNQPEGTVSYHTAAFSLIQVLDLWAKGHAYQPALVQTSKAIRNKKRHHPFKKQGPGGGAPAGPTPASISAISPATLKGLCAISATLKWKCIRGTSREQFAETADGEYFGPHLLIEGIDPPWARLYVGKTLTRQDVQEGKAATMVIPPDLAEAAKGSEWDSSAWMYQGDPYDDGVLSEREPQPDPTKVGHCPVADVVAELARHVLEHYGDEFLDKWGVETNGGVKWMRYTEKMGVGCSHVDMNRGQVAGVLVMLQPAEGGGRTLLGLQRYGSNVVHAKLTEGELLVWRNFTDDVGESIANAGAACLRDHTGEWVTRGEKRILSIGLYRMDRCNFFDVKIEALEHNMDMLKTIVAEYTGKGKSFHGCDRAAAADEPCCACAGCISTLGGPEFAWATEELTNDMGDDVDERCFCSQIEYEKGTNRQRYSLRSFLDAHNLLSQSIDDVKDS